MGIDVLNTDDEVTKMLVNSLEKNGIEYTVDYNPSPEKIVKIKAKIERNKNIRNL
tara:strand:+ start:55 stop:219 length:165 start_codon:yes stop_codon:yes gene_type:complete